LIQLGIAKEEKIILIAVLNWGLGHASRMIPIIQGCLDNNKTVIVASDGISGNLLRKEFPQLTYVELPKYNIKYHANFTGLAISSQWWKIARSIWKEQIKTKELIQNYKPDCIISDNRFGVRSSQIRSIFITHQINIITPFKIFNPLVRGVNEFLINRFDECWVPDFPDHSLSGTLSDDSNIKNIKFLGPLSRLKPLSIPIKHAIAVILSGPEPQRSLLEREILSVLDKENFSFILIRGTDVSDTPNSKAIQTVALADAACINQCIEEAQVVICRSGYTSLMDLVALDKKAILIPTPGQPEQEYLGKHVENHPLFTVVEQKKIANQLVPSLLQLLN